MKNALLLIDLQTGMDSPQWGPRNNPDAEQNAARLLQHWRAQSAPVFHVRHLSTTPGSPLHPDQGAIGYKAETAPLPGEPAYDKSVNSAFIGTTLEADLRAAGITALTICGLITPHCVSTTARMAANLGFAVTLAHDACAAFAAAADTSWCGSATFSAEQVHVMAVSELHGEFATARSTDDILRT
jgi:nicotinamidase-related amidase